MRRNKIVAAFTAAAIFASASGMAIAAPSPTRPSRRSPVVWTFSFGSSSSVGTATISDSSNASDDTMDFAARVADLMADAGYDAKAYFGEDAQTTKDIQAAAGLYGGEKFEVSEIEPFEMDSYSGGSLNVTMSFDAQFKKNRVVAVLIGIDKGDHIEWHVVQGVVNSGGSVSFFMNDALASAVANGTAVIAVASSANAFAE